MNRIAHEESSGDGKPLLATKRSWFERLLLLWLLVSSLLAFFWPADNTEFYSNLKPALSWMIGITMFSLGSLLPVEEVRRLLKQLPLVGLGTLIQASVMPLAAIAMVYVLGLTEGYRIGFLIVGCVPGAMASNVLTLAARGNVSYSICLTTLATVLSPITVPLLLWMTANISGVDFDPVSMMLKLLLTVLLPVVGGFTLARLSSLFNLLAQRCASLVANITILAIIAVVVGLNRDGLASISLMVFLGLLLINLIGYVGGYFAGRLAGIEEPLRRALTLEVGMQNAGLGTVIAVNQFAQFEDAAIAPAIYTFGCMFTGTILATVWSEISVGPPEH